MNSNYWWYIFFGLLITLVGLLTNKFFFLFLLFPFSLIFKSKKEEYVTYDGGHLFTLEVVY